jgi:hypothetical protein
LCLDASGSFLISKWLPTKSANFNVLWFHFYFQNGRWQNRQIVNGLRFQWKLISRDSYLHTKSEKIWLLFTFVLNWVFLQFPWQWQAFWNSQASKPFIHMPYNISIKFHPIQSTLNFSRFLWQPNSYLIFAY